MDANRFDRLVRSLSTTGTRRGVLHVLSTMPFVGGLATLLDTDETDADGRRKRRKKRHKHGKGRHRGGHKQKKCKSKSRAKTCAGKCGTVKNTCKKKIDCGPCVECDVCASGCAFTSLQEAIDAAEPESTIRLCAETYGGIISITKDLTLIGAGDGEDGTVLDGQGNGRVVTVNAGAIVALEGLRITGGNNIAGGGGIFIPEGNLTLTRCTVTGNTAGVGGGGIYTPNTDSIVTLTNCTVSDNTAGIAGGGFYNPGGRVTLNDSSVSSNVAGDDGGGLDNELDGIVTLNGTSSVTGNTATNGEGGGIFNNGGAVTLNDDSRVTDNEPDDCAGSGPFNGNACGP